MPHLRHRSFVLAPASPSFNTPIICSSVNRFDFMVRSHVGGLYSWAVLFAGITSRRHISGVSKTTNTTSLRSQDQPSQARHVPEHVIRAFVVLEPDIHQEDPSGAES